MLSSPRVGHHDDATDEQTQRDEPFLSTMETVIDEGDAGPGPHLFGVRKVQTVFGDVGLVLSFVPLVSHPQSYLLL